MEWYEAEALLERASLRHRDMYECARLGVYATAQTHSKKRLKPEEVLPFPWDAKAETPERPRAAAPADPDAIRRLREKQAAFAATHEMPEPPEPKKNRTTTK